LWFKAYGSQCILQQDRVVDAGQNHVHKHPGAQMASLWHRSIKVAAIESSIDYFHPRARSLSFSSAKTKCLCIMVPHAA
jgi:hypothetical protein